MRPNDDFKPGELLEWHMMSNLLRQLGEQVILIQTTLNDVKEMCSELAGVFGAEHSDIKIRLDDLEETLGDCLQQFKDDQEQDISLALDAHRTIDQWLI